MVTQYPHTITVTILTANAVRDALGNWIQPAVEPAEYQVECRAEPNGNRMVVLADGSMIQVAFIVYLPLTAPDIPADTLVSISNGAKGKVKQFYRGQLNCRLWL